MSFRLFKDSFRNALGFETRKESLDRQISDYKKNEVNFIKHEISKRQILISQLQTKLNTIDQVMKVYDEFLAHYEAILLESEYEITKAHSNVIFRITSPDKQKQFEGNYSILSILVSKKENSDYILSFSLQLQNIVENGKYVLANAIVLGKGTIVVKGIPVHNFKIFQEFSLLQLMFQLEMIKDINGNILNADIQDFYSLVKLKELITIYKHKLELYKIQFSSELKKLNLADSNDKYSLEQIEDIKNLIKSSEEYNIAKASYEYLEQINKSR